MTRRLFAVLTLLAASSLALAQGSGSTAPPRNGSTGNTASSDDFKVTRSIEGRITEVKKSDNLVVIESNNGKRSTLHVSSETKISVLNGKDGNSALKLGDLKSGQKIKATYRPSDWHAVQLRLVN